MKMMKRIIHLVSALQAGGIERLLVSMAPYWDRNDFEIEVWCLSANSETTYLEQLNQKGINTRVIGSGARGRLEFGLVAKLAKMLGNWNADLVHTHTVYPLFMVTLLRSAFRMKVAHVHHQHSRPTKYQDRFARYLGRYFPPEIVLAVSASTAEDARRIQPNLTARILVIHNGIEFGRESTSSPSRSNLGQIYTSARLVREKNIDVLLRAFRFVTTKHSSVTLTIFGDGDCREALQELATSLGVERQVCFAGYVLHPEDEYGKKGIFVLPSRSEPFGLALLEAMAMGKPCIATDAGGPSEIVQPEVNGLLVKPSDEEDLGVAILRLLENPELALRLGQNAKVRALDFHIQKTVRAIEDVYRLLVLN
jgi:glycosyltransferase involved in cell wall biosynthesis